MIINGDNYPSIGFIRAKPLPDQPDQWSLSIYPPDTGLLHIITEPGAEPTLASWAEVEVNTTELKRICAAAPHLLPGVAYRIDPSMGLWASRGAQKVLHAQPENRPGPSSSTLTAKFVGSCDEPL